MSKMNDAMERIRILECPTGELENRVAEILEKYGVAERNEVNLNRVGNLDQDEAQAYSVKVTGENQSFVVLAKSGLDDYVAKVVDVYSK
jgi:hypothetical protein